MAPETESLVQLVGARPTAESARVTKEAGIGCTTTGTGAAAAGSEASSALLVDLMDSESCNIPRGKDVASEVADIISMLASSADVAGDGAANECGTNTV